MPRTAKRVDGALRQHLGRPRRQAHALMQAIPVLDELPTGDWTLSALTFGTAGEFVVAHTSKHETRFYQGGKRVADPVHPQWGHC